MKKRFVLLTLLLLMIGLSAWADEPYTEFEYNGIVVIDGLKFAVTLPEDGKGEALLMGVDDTYSEARAATRGIIAVQNLLEAYIEFKEKQVKRVTGDAFIMPPPYGIFLRARGLSVDADNMPSLQRTATVDPDKEYTCELKVIGYSALQNNTDITELIIPETVTTIWGSAFDGCSNLQKVTLPSKLLFIGFRAFAYCNSLTEINIPNSVSEIQPGAFMNCKGLKKVSLPSGLTEISKYLFHHCENLQSVTGGENATKIGNNAFECCYKLTDYTLPSALDSICDRAFLYCQQLKSITIPRTLRGFGVEAFCGCTRLQSVVFESGSALKEINKSVFTTTSLTSVDIPNSVERIGYQAFAYSDLSNVKMPSNLIEIGDSAFHFTKLTAVTIPSSVTKICTGAFDDCGELANLTFESDSRLKTIGANAFTAVAITELTVPDGVTTIGEAAFSACGNLESLTLSMQLTSMGDEAFMDCYALKSVTAPMASPFSIERYTFSSTTYTNATLYVPKSTKSLYQKTDSWSRFQKIVEFGDGPIADSEPYVVYNDGILTFYCDNQRSSREGTTYDLNVGNKAPKWIEHNETITKAVFDISFANAKPTSTCYWFYDCRNLTQIYGIKNLNTSRVVNMNKMFYVCHGLTTLDVSNFETENVTTMELMFYSCERLANLNVSNFNTEKVTNMNGMFALCEGLTDLDLSSFNTSNVTDMEIMFYECNGLTNLNVSGLNTSNVTKMHSMFRSCRSLTTLDVSGFNTSNVTDMSSMFYDCKGLTTLDLSNFDTSNVTDMSHMFWGSANLKHLILGNNFTSNESTNVTQTCDRFSKVTFTGDIPTTINSQFFSGVGTAEAPVTLTVPEQYKANYAAKFDGNKFYGGYFTLIGDEVSELKDGDIFTANTVEGVEMTFKVISAKDKIVQVGTGDGNTSAVDKDYAGTLTIPKEINGYKVVEIASRAFSYCNFSDIALPSGLIYIDTEAFYLCESLKSIRIPSSLQNMSVVAFVSCTSVESIVVEEGNEYFDSREGCNAIIRKDDKTLIRGCKNSFIPSGVERINFAAFQQTPLVGSFVIPEGVTYIGQSAFVSATMSSISLPSTLTYIGGLSFQNCNGIESVAIPEGVTYIGNYAFSFCDKLNRVTIPASVTEIGEKAFIGSTQLKTIVSYLTEPCAIADNVFMVNDLDDGNNSLINATLYVPFGSKTIYENTDGWKNFKNIVELNATVGDVTGDGEVTKEDITEVETEILEPSAVFDPNKDVNRDGVVNVADIVEGNNIRNSQ